MTDQPQVPDLQIDDNVPGGLAAESRRPYRILFAADFAGSQSGSLTGPLSSQVVEVGAESFDAVMAEARPTVRFTTTDPTVSGNVMVEVDLAFDSLKALAPARLVEQIPATASLAAVRGHLVERMRGKATGQQLAEAVERRIAADAGLSWVRDALKWSPAPAQASPGAVDDVLSQLDLGDAGTAPAPSPPASPLGKAIASAAMAGTGIPAAEASTLRRAIAEIDRRCDAWLNAVLHAEPVQRVEAAWRSLAFLISRCEARRGVRVMALHASAAELLERFRTLLIDPVFDAGADAPDLIVTDTSFSNSAPHVEAMDELAQHAASLPAVALVGIGPGFFGMKHAWQAQSLPSLATLFDQWQYAKWNTLRKQPYARLLCAVFGRCLLRAPYEREGAADLEYRFREEAVGETHFLWTSGTLAAACNAARSVADHGWPNAVAGLAHGRAEGFATAMGGPKGDKRFGPTDTQMPQDKIEELAMAGLSAAGGVRDLDDVIIWNGVCAAKPAAADLSGLLEISLPYQLVAARLSILLLDLRPHLAGMAADKVPGFVTTHVRSWLADESGEGGELAADAVHAQTGARDDAPGVNQLVVTIRPPETVLPAGIPIVLGYALP